MKKTIIGIVALNAFKECNLLKLKAILYNHLDNDMDTDTLGKYFIDGDLSFNIDIINPGYFSHILSFYGCAITPYSCKEIEDTLKSEIEKQLSKVKELYTIHFQIECKEG